MRDYKGCCEKMFGSACDIVMDVMGFIEHDGKLPDEIIAVHPNERNKNYKFYASWNLPREIENVIDNIIESVPLELNAVANCYRHDDLIKLAISAENGLSSRQRIHQNLLCHLGLMDINKSNNAFMCNEDSKTKGYCESLSKVAFGGVTEGIDHYVGIPKDYMREYLNCLFAMDADDDLDDIRSTFERKRKRK